MISHTIKNNNPFREPAVYYAEASSYIDAMDYIEFMMEEGWKVLVPPFVTRVTRIPIQRIEQKQPDWVDRPEEWGFVLHKFHDTDFI